MPVRVHMLIDSLRHGGAELLIPTLAAVAPDAGIDISVGYLQDLDDSPGRERLREFGVEPTLVGIPDRLYTSALPRIHRHLRDVRPQIVHTHLSASDLAGGFVARAMGIPSVSTVHTTEWRDEDRVDQVKTDLTALVRRGCAARVVAVSEGARERYLAFAPERPERIVTIHNGVRDRPQSGAGRRVRDELGLEADDLVVATLSKLRPEKAHDVALKAVDQLRDAFPRLRLLIVGDGVERPALERAAAPMGNAIKFAGYRDDVMAVLDAVDVVIHPSRREAFPTTLLEAMAASVSVVATDVGGVPEIVEDGVTGVLVDAPPRPEVFAAALAPLLRDAALRNRLAGAGRKRFTERFTAEAWAERLRGLYDEILAERARPSR
jgi:glycosyltransferase involved in cell wall biosynthesis